RGLAEACVTETIVALGDHFLEPSYEDLGSALDERCERWGVRIVALMLAATADDDFPAREVCARLFDEDPRFALDALGPVQEDHAPKPVARHTPTPNEADAEAKREARRERRRAQKGQARPARVAHPTYRRATRDSSSAPEPEGGADTAAFAATRPSRTEMRAVLVVGTYDDVRYDDPLVGAVVDAFIPFGDPDDERGAGKTRPCVVLAACADDRLVVRPCYSGGGLRSGDWKSVRVGDAQAAGLDRESYVSTEEFAVRRAPAARAVRGWLSREDWNAL
ncbi:MAG TPA: hypothetical protein VEP49_13850, partial [Acidimicrobiia bacterium]|nr:hypothetical protein [Acidimicrobiia bacterium]